MDRIWTGYGNDIGNGYRMDIQPRVPLREPQVDGPDKKDTITETKP